ncbi:putative mRNA cap methyltransferase [Corchorus capsularis]|uniref:Putative mRNA cap methyltransferase n=1 Tax=Corchorus capsularis TaxID=210143 RepID=A0A1R3J0Y7_COCAP|nr:putative mRNA cap methyltransferase [Corchorus capsularis]
MAHGPFYNGWAKSPTQFSHRSIERSERDRRERKRGKKILKAATEARLRYRRKNGVDMVGSCTSSWNHSWNALRHGKCSVLHSQSLSRPGNLGNAVRKKK